LKESGKKGDRLSTLRKEEKLLGPSRKFLPGPNRKNLHNNKTKQLHVDLFFFLCYM
jgi:hypothetical protein